MRWFKHDSDATQDAKVKKLLLKYGAVGYAIYFHCLELIASDITESNVTFELEHDSEIIADNLKIKGTTEQGAIEIVEEIMLFCISLKLFDEKNNRVFCFKLLKRLDTSMTSSPSMRSLIKSAKESHDSVMIESCKTRLDQTRLDQTTPKDGGDFYNMKSLLALCVKYLGWNPVMSAGQSETMRPLTSILKDDVEKGFIAAAKVNAKSITYVIKAAQSNVIAINEGVTNLL